MRILIALDDSPYSMRALEFVTRMRWPAGSRTIVVSVIPPPIAAVAVGPPVAEDTVRRQAEEVVADAERRLRDVGFAAEGRVAEGDPREALVQAARVERADLLVMGSHGRTGIAKLMLGSVSSHVVTHAACSVLVVKQDD